MILHQILCARCRQLSAFLIVACAAVGLAVRSAPAEDFREVLVYPVAKDGSLMHWLGVAPLQYSAAFIGDSMNYDVFRRDRQSELTVRPRSGDKVQGYTWRKMHYAGAVQGPSMCELFNVAGRYFDYAITCNLVYVYSPQDRPNAIFAASSDDALKVIFNGKRIWSNQIQRSPTYDSDQAPAPLRKGWNTLLCVVDQVWGGHLLCARFLDGGEGVTDLELALDPPALDAVRHPAEPYNRAAAEQMRAADRLRGDGQLAEAMAACDEVLARYSLAEVAPRAAYVKALCCYSPAGEKSLGQPGEAAKSIQALLARYGDDLLAEYALLDLAKMQEVAQKDLSKAEATCRSFEGRYPRSTLAAKSVTEVARLLTAQGKYEEAILTYRRAIKQHPNSDEVMTATVGIGDAYRLSGEKEKARKQYQDARAMAQDWHDNKYGVDIGKQAWLRGILEHLRGQDAGR